mgnify:CR=1 FL=1
MAADPQIGLLDRQWLSGRHAQLPLHKIHPGDGFRHRVLHLQARVHFHEEKLVRMQTVGSVNDELDRARPLVADRFGGPHRGLPHGLAHCRRHARRGRLLDHFLMPPLQ